MTTKQIEILRRKVWAAARAEALTTAEHGRLSSGISDDQVLDWLGGYPFKRGVTQTHKRAPSGAFFRGIWRGLQ